MPHENQVIRENIRLHKKEAEKYEKSKVEIFNEREQNRLDSVLRESIDNIDTDSPEIKGLDIGCGTGNMLENLSPLCHEVIGLDLSEDMLSVASSNHLGEEENIRLIRGRAAHLPFADNTFDIVTAYSVFHHLPYFSDPVSEITRVLKPRGVLYIDHEPIERDNPLVKLYVESSAILNGNPSDGTEGMERHFCDYHIHEYDGGISVPRILELLRDNDLEVLRSEKYLAPRSHEKNPLRSLLKHLIDSEWLLIGRKKENSS